MARVTRDLVMALRGLRRTPTFAIAVLAILGLGIGMAVAMFATLQTILVRRLPVQDQDRIAVLWTYQVPTIEYSVTARDLPDIRRASRATRDVAGVVHWGSTPEPFLDGDRTVVLRTGPVTTNYFDVLGARPELGRFLRAEDAAAGAPEVMVLSYGAWQSQFGGSRSIVGRRLINPWSRQAATVVGIAPPGLDYPVGIECWWPMEQGSESQVLAVARLAPGVGIDAAREDFFSIGNRLQPGLKLTGAKAETFTTAVVGNAQPILIVLAAAVALLLAIACVNVGTLFLVRAGARTGELAVRRALGASRGDLVRQLLVESVLLAAAGGVLGVVCARALLAGLVALAPTQLPRLDDLRLHSNLLGAAIGVTTIAVLLFGVLPALAATGIDVAAPLQLNVRSGTETRRRRVARQWLVASQVALALVMLAGAGLLGRSLLTLEHLSLGYRTEHVSIGSVTINFVRYDTLEKVTRLSEQIVRRIQTIPGVTAATPILLLPFVGPNVWRVPFQAEGQLAADSGATPSWPVEGAGPEYFRTFSTPIVRGRAFLDTDLEGAPPVVVVSQSVVRRFWPGEDPIGKRIRVAPLEPASDTAVFDWRTVVGVVPDTRFRALRETWPMVYLPQRQFFGAWQGRFAVRSIGDLGGMAPALAQAIHEIDPTLAIYDMRSMDDVLGGPLAEPRLVALLVAAFGGVALLLAAVGLYGVVASTVREQTREIGIRVALGATPARIRDAVVRQALVVTGAGAAGGLAAAFTATRLLRALLFGVSPADPLTLGAACFVLLAVGLLAAYLPARRATRIDPVRALRAE